MGDQIAFSAQYAGNVDAYLLPVEGGEPSGSPIIPVRTSSKAGHPTGGKWFRERTQHRRTGQYPSLYKIGTGGGPENAMPMPRAYQGKISPDGKKIAYRMNNSWDEERRKYRGGQNRPIWIEDLSSHEVITPAWTDSREMDPACVGDVVFFLSDRDG